MGKGRKYLLTALAGMVLLAGCGAEQEKADTEKPIALEDLARVVSEDGAGTGSMDSVESKDFAESAEAEKGVPGSMQGEDVSGSEEESQAGKEEQPEIKTVTISAVGDVSLGNYTTQGYEVSFDWTYDTEQSTAYYLKNVRDIFDADDVTIVNLEGPLTTLEEVRVEKEFEIKGRPEYVKILTDGDVEIATLANNHILDFKEEGRQDTVALLKEEGIQYAYDGNLAVYEVDGIKIGVVAVSYLGQSVESENNLKNGIENLKGQGVDIIAACCHWGEEYHYYPEDYQVRLAENCIDWGADLVLGCHPHILESIGVYKGKYIAYSMGNFCFGANRNPSDKDSMIFQPTFTFVDGVKQEETSLHIIPCSISSVSARNNYQPTPASGEEAVRIIDKINELSRDYGVQFDYEGNLVK